MKYILRYTAVLLLLVLIKVSASGQDNNIYRASNASILRVNGNSNTENLLKDVTIGLPNNANQLTLNLAFRTIQ